MKSFYYIRGLEQLGPFTIDQLRDEKVNQETLIWFEGLETWKEASKIDDLFSLFELKPPPIPKKEILPPNPKTEITNPELLTPETEPKSNFDFRPILIGMAFVVFIIFVNEKFVNHKTEAVKREAFVQAQQLATQAVQENEKQKQQEVINQQKLLEAEINNIEEQEKEQAKNNIYNLVTAEENYSYRKIGGISDVTVSVINNTRFRIDLATIEVSYIKEDGGVWKTEQVEVSNIEAFSKKSVYAPNSDRGTKIRTLIIGISSNELDM